MEITGRKTVACCSIALAATLVLCGRAGLSRAADPVCGNGVIEAGEACDDGNVNDGDGCSSACTVEQQCYDPGNTFSFFTWSDSYTGGCETGIQRILADAVSSATHPGRIVPRFWFGAGDIPFMGVSYDRLDQLNGAISDSKYPFTCDAGSRRFPWFIAVGNHDVDGSAVSPMYQYDYWSNYVGPRLPQSLVGMSNFRWGPDDGYDARTTYSFDYKNAHFVVLNQYFGDPAYPTTDPIGCVRAELYDWIDQDLARSSKPVRFVFGHEPAWSYCSNVAGYGGSYCPLGSIDNQNPPLRPRPYSTTGDWSDPFGLHWGDSLEDGQCPQGSRAAFWAMLAQHNVVAHFAGHNHSYSARLIQGDGTRRNDIPAYTKEGPSFRNDDGVWEVNTGKTHNTSGALYVLTTVRDNVVTFESYDQRGYTEPFHLVESWSVDVGAESPVPVNSPPVLRPVGNTTATAESPLAFTAAATDPDAGQTLTFSLIGAPPGASIDAVSGAFAWTPSASQVGVSTFTVRVTDNGVPALFDEEAISVTVTASAGNQPPVLSPIGNRTVAAESQLTFAASATDPDAGQTLTFGLVGAPAGASIDAVSGAFAWTPTSSQAGVATFTVRVTDNGIPALFDEEVISVTVTVNAANRPPALSPIGNRTVDEWSTLSFTATGTDPDAGQALSYSLVGAPAGASIDPATGAFAWTPTSSQVGNSTFAVRVTDNGSPAMYAEESITVTVNAAPAPILSRMQHGTASLDAGSDLATVTVPEVDPGRAFLVFGCSFDDSDPGFGQVSGALTNAATLTFRRATGGAGAPPVAVAWSLAEFTGGVAVQRGSSDMAAATDGILNVPVGPVDTSRSFPLISFRNAGTTYSDKDFVKARITSPTNLELSVNNTASPGGTVEWQVVQFGESLVQTGEVSFGAKTKSKEARISYSEPAKSWLIVSWRAGSKTGPNIGQKMVRGTIRDATTLAFERSESGVPVALTWHLVEFLDATTVRRGMAGFTASAGMIDVPLSPEVDPSRSFAAASGLWNRGGTTPYAADDNPGVATVTMEVSSGANLRLTRGAAGSSPANVNWSVVTFAGPANAPPVLWPVGNKTATVGSMLTFTADATDPDAGQAVSFSLIGAPAGASIDPVSGVFAWTPTPSQAGAATFTVRVTDNGVPALSDDEVISVTVDGTP